MRSCILKGIMFILGATLILMLASVMDDRARCTTIVNDAKFIKCGNNFKPYNVDISKGKILKVTTEKENTLITYIETTYKVDDNIYYVISSGSSNNILTYILKPIKWMVNNE